MKHQEGYLKGVRDTDIFYQYWLPEGDPKATLLVVHGVREHSGRYMNVVNHLVPSGYGVYGIDHIGHGKSAGERVYVERFQDYTKTLKKCFDKKCRYPEHLLSILLDASYLSPPTINEFFCRQ